VVGCDGSVCGIWWLSWRDVVAQLVGYVNFLDIFKSYERDKSVNNFKICAQ
jgi:hypothetical protein